MRKELCYEVDRIALVGHMLTETTQLAHTYFSHFLEVTAEDEIMETTDELKEKPLKLYLKHTALEIVLQNLPSL